MIKLVVIGYDKNNKMVFYGEYEDEIDYKAAIEYCKRKFHRYQSYAKFVEL